MKIILFILILLLSYSCCSKIEHFRIIDYALYGYEKGRFDREMNIFEDEFDAKQQLFERNIFLKPLPLYYE